MNTKERGGERGKTKRRLEREVEESVSAPEAKVCWEHSPIIRASGSHTC